MVQQNIQEINPSERLKEALHPFLSDLVRIKGRVKFEVFGPDGKLKQVAFNKNLVVDEGDALIADLLQNTTEKTKLDSTNGYIAVGTGGIAAQKSHTWVQTQTGSAEVMDTGYPQTKGDWGAANDNVIVYKATFEAGDLNDTGIDEAVLANNTSDVGAETMAYAQMTSVDVGTSDTLAVTWEITLLGA